jgi:uncharacterized RDD family membrane protein YckC
VSTTESPLSPAVAELEYAGFWIRVWAAVIDSLLVLLLTTPLLVMLYGWEDVTDAGLPTTFRPTQFLVEWVLPSIALLLFWRFRSATPGKMAIKARIVDATTGQAPRTGQLIGRYFGYFVSTIPFGLGLLWVAFDRRKQGWHDKLANTVVIRTKREPVRFGEPVASRPEPETPRSA